MILRCTQKLLKELKSDFKDEISEKNFLYSWHANIFYIERRKCVLITNDSTLFTMFIHSLRKPDFDTFYHVFGQNIFKNLLNEEIPQNQIEMVLRACEKIKLAKTNNRSVLGSMNDQKYQLEAQVQSQGGLAYTDIYELNYRLNRHILSAIDYKRPIIVFKEKLNKIST